MTDEQKARADEADYVAGFGKPPRASQFAKGKSGNPAGRPRGARSMRTLLQEILDQPVTISIKGVPRQVSAKEAVLTRLMSQALTGKTQDAALFVSLIKTTLPEQFAEEADDALSTDEAKLLEAIATWGGRLMGVPAFTRAEYDAALRADLMGFFVWAWSQLHPSQILISGWHLHALAAALTKCATGEIKRLIINLPPRNLKSEFASVVFPTWLLGRDPSRKIINITYSEALTKDFARGSKALMETADYKRVFPATRINPRANADADFTLMKHRGKRFGTT
ncbi:hypothetical protein LTR94_027177, partial [Friedmanniomyces endolithicus]